MDCDAFLRTIQSKQEREDEKDAIAFRANSAALPKKDSAIRGAILQSVGLEKSLADQYDEKAGSHE